MLHLEYILAWAKIRNSTERGASLVEYALLVALIAVGVLLVAAVGAAQFQRRGGRFGYGQIRENPTYDGAFQFCRIMFRNASNGDGGGWAVDYPKADQNLSYRFS